jgi:hypothetical protein
MRALREQRHPSPARNFCRAVLVVVVYFVVLIFLSWLLVTPPPPEPIKPSAEPIEYQVVRRIHFDSGTD